MKRRTPALRAPLSVTSALLAFVLTACTQGGSNAPQATTDTAGSSSAPAAGTTEAAHAIGQLATFVAYAHGLPASADNKQCAIDYINGQPAANVTAFAADASAGLGGWAGDGQGHPADNFLLVLKSQTQSYATPIHPSVARTDVAKSLNSDGMTNSGFTINISLHGLASGGYSMYIADPANPDNVCDLKHSFTLQ